MNFAEKVFNLHNEIITDIKELVLKHGIITDTGKHSLDCWGYRMANSLITIHNFLKIHLLNLSLNELMIL